MPFKDDRRLASRERVAFDSIRRKGQLDVIPGGEAS